MRRLAALWVFFVFLIVPQGWAISPTEGWAPNKAPRSADQVRSLTPAEKDEIARKDAFLLTARLMFNNYIPGDTVAQYAHNTGISGGNLVMAVAISYVESAGFYADAIANEPNGTVSTGLWQINSIHTQWTQTQLLDPQTNAQAAYSISTSGTNWIPWSTYKFFSIYIFPSNLNSARTYASHCDSSVITAVGNRVQVTGSSGANVRKTAGGELASWTTEANGQKGSVVGAYQAATVTGDNSTYPKTYIWWQIEFDDHPGVYVWAAEINLSKINDPLPVPNISLNYNGTSIPYGDQSPSTAKGTDFGNVQIGTSPSRTFTIVNSGTGSLNLTGGAKVSLNNSVFYVSSMPPSPIAANGGSATFAICFEPGSQGLQTATVSIPNSDSTKDPFTFKIQGTGKVQERVDPQLEYNGVAINSGDSSPSSSEGTDFGSVNVGSQSSVRTFNFYNYGTINLNLASSPFVVITGSNASEFFVTSQPSTPISPNGYSNLSVRFQPSGTGLRSANISIRYDDTYGLGSTSPYNVAIQGTGISVEPTLSYITISGSTQVNENSGVQYTCTATYSDNTTANVTNNTSWGQNSGYASINATGYLTTNNVSSDQPCQITASFGGKSDTHDITIKNVSATLSYITISGSTQVNENSGVQYTCTATYSDNTTANVTNNTSWGQNSGYASINATGYLTTNNVSSDQPCQITASFGGKSDTHDITIKNVSATLSYITISGSTQVNENSGAQYTCTATYSDNTTANVTNNTSWGQNSGYASINATGYLTTNNVSSDQPCQITASFGGKSDTHDITIKNVSATLSYITISGSTQVNENSGAQYTCTATYSDNTTANVTNSTSWNQNSGYASMNTTGYLTTYNVSSDQPCQITASFGGKSDTHDITIKNVSATLSYITISGSTQVNENSGAQYTCTATYSDNTTANVTNSTSWNQNSGYAFMNTTGYLTTYNVSSDQPCQITASFGGKSDTHDITIKNVSATLSYITISGSTQVNENSGAQYTCTATYSDNTTANVTNNTSWGQNSGYASINATGYLTTNNVSSDQPCKITASLGGKSDTHDIIIKNGTGSVLQNGNFESGYTAWTLSGMAEIAAGGYPRSGTNYLILGGLENENDAAYQTITIPSAATAATLSFYYNISSIEDPGNIAYDFFSATICNASNTILATVGSWSNVNQTAPGNPNYKNKTFNLLPFAGQTIRIYFSSVNDGVYPTTFRVDDVSVVINTGSDLVTNLNRSGYTLGSFGSGQMVYSDRTFSYKDPIPASLKGQVAIRTCNDDKNWTGGTLFSFKINKTATVYIARDPRSPSLPSWMSGWKKSIYRLQTADGVRDLYYKAYSAGTVSLGGNRESSMPAIGSMYSVIVVPGSVMELTVQSISRTGYALGCLAAGQMLYSDRTYAFNNPIPGIENGQIYIRTLNNDKDKTGSGFLSFKVNKPVLVYLARDARITKLPSWMTGWTKSIDRIPSGDGWRNLYFKQFPAGTVSLGGNRDSSMSTGTSMYSVILVQ